MTITPETTPDHPSYPSNTQALSPARLPDEYKLAGVIIDPFTPPTAKEYPLAGRKPLCRHEVTKKEKELLGTFQIIALAGVISREYYPTPITKEELCFLPEHVFTKKDLLIARAIHDHTWPEIVALLAPVTPQEESEQQKFLDDYRRIYEKLQEYNIDFDGYSNLYNVLKGLKVSEVLMVHSILTHGLKKAHEQHLPPPPATDAELMHHAEKWARIIEKLKRYRIDIPE